MKPKNDIKVSLKDFKYYPIAEILLLLDIFRLIQRYENAGEYMEREIEAKEKLEYANAVA